MLAALEYRSLHERTNYGSFHTECNGRVTMFTTEGTGTKVNNWI